MKKAFALILIIFMLICSGTSIVCASGTSFYDTSEAINTKIKLNRLVEEYKSQDEQDTSRVVSEIVELWNKNGINITLPQKELGSRNNAKQGYDRYILPQYDSFEIIYCIQYDGSRDNFIVWMPNGYRYVRKLASLVISYFTGEDITGAYKEYDDLKASVRNSNVEKIGKTIGIYLTITSDNEILEIERSVISKPSPTDIPKDAVQSTINYFSNLFSNKSTPKPAASPSLKVAKTIIDIKTFLYDFNFYGAFLGNGHKLNLENAEISILNDTALIKTIFNNCEILSLSTNKSMTDIISIHCTLSTATKNSDKYLEDFLSLLMESMLSAGIDSQSVSDTFTKFGKANAFNVGDKDETIIDGIRVSYKVTKETGISFTIERVK